jgi:cytidylate kinase
MIIVIDGPAGSGKSSTAKAIANRLGIQFLDSGALYRAVTLLWLSHNKPDNSFFDQLKTFSISFEYRNEAFSVTIDGEGVSRKIREQRVADNVSRIASNPKVREYVNDLMRKATADQICIADGRDLGTAVFPDADLKFFMVASIDVRAERRYKEMKEQGQDVSLAEIKANIASRDKADSGREHDPLTQAADAIEIDTSGKTFDQQVDHMISIINEKLNIT